MHGQLGYRSDVDGLRGIAIAAVLAYHAAPGAVPGGFAGVDVFFVISGFLISGILFDSLDTGTFSLAAFYARRVRRLFPALLLVVTATLAAGAALLLPGELRELQRHAAASLGYVINIVLWRDAGYFSDAAASVPLLHLWSLGVEEQFYLVWPAALWLCLRLRINRAVLIGLAVTGSFAVNVLLVGRDPAGAFYLPFTRLWELAMGAVIAAVARSGWRPPRGVSHALSLAGALLIALSIAWLGSDLAYPGWWALAPTLGAAAMIAAGEAGAANRWVLGRQALVFVGLISYPLYLWHWPLLSFAHILTYGQPGWALIGAMLSVATLAAWLTFRFVERPIRSARTLRVRPLVTVAALSAVAGMAALAGLVAPVADGPPAADIQAAIDEQSYRERYRERRCFLMPDQTVDAYSADCVDPPGTGGPLVMLWGDSHGAHLYPGLQALQQRTPFRIAQFTVAECPPVEAYGPPAVSWCEPANRLVLGKVTALQPDVVVLAGRWWSYRLDPTDLPATIQAIRARSRARIVVLGPGLDWTDNLPRLLTRRLTQRPELFPERLAVGVDDWSRLDADLRAQSTGAGASYVSPYPVFCNQEGCLTRVHRQADGLTTWDENHLTPAGSQYLIEHVAAQILPAFP